MKNINPVKFHVDYLICLLRYPCAHTCGKSHFYRSLVKSLEMVDPRKMKREEKLVFWLNVHNSLVMHVWYLEPYLNLAHWYSCNLNDFNWIIVNDSTNFKRLHNWTSLPISRGGLLLCPIRLFMHAFHFSHMTSK